MSSETFDENGKILLGKKVKRKISELKKKSEIGGI